MKELEARLEAELEARLGKQGAAGAMADLRRLDAALSAASDAEQLREKAARVDGLQAQVRHPGCQTNFSQFSTTLRVLFLCFTIECCVRLCAQQQSRAVHSAAAISDHVTTGIAHRNIAFCMCR